MTARSVSVSVQEEFLRVEHARTKQRQVAKGAQKRAMIEGLVTTKEPLSERSWGLDYFRPLRGWKRRWTSASRLLSTWV
jgi:hypothetical protein